MDERIFYAIGDVHGMADKLERLHDAISAHAARAAAKGAIVHLGDYVDRGPDSRAVIDLVMKLQDRVGDAADVYALRGNHEQMMLDAVDKTSPQALSHWLINGGAETLASYGVRSGRRGWRAAIEPAHLAWLRQRPTLLCAGRLAFVHAGIEPTQFPDCDDQVRLWTRSDRFFETSQWPERDVLAGLRVVHGHTPTDDDCPYVDARRINVDTGAVYGGPLTCAVLAPGRVAEFLYA